MGRKWEVERVGEYRGRQTEGVPEEVEEGGGGEEGRPGGEGREGGRR